LYSIIYQQQIVIYPFCLFSKRKQKKKLILFPKAYRRKEKWMEKSTTCRPDNAGQCHLSQCLEREKPVAEAPAQENSEQTKPVGPGEC
jgi:hypothetical protein